MSPIKLTPLDIHNKEFSRSFRGYNESEVDEFLDVIVADLEQLIREKEDLDAHVLDLESRLEHYKGLEETLKNAIVLAQKAADEIKEAAAKEAELIKKQAEMASQRMKDEASEALKKTYQEIEEQHTKIQRFKVEMKTFLQGMIESLDTGVDRVARELDLPWDKH